MRLVIGLLVLSTLGLAACGDESPSVDAEATRPAATPGAPDDVVQARVLGSGSWSGARTTSEGDVLITFVGGPPYETGDPCSIAYDVVTAEREDEVRVSFSARSPRPPPGSFGCDDQGYPRQALVDLERPLGARRFVEAQFERVQPVFDGTTLLDPAALPEGWRLLWEGGGDPNRGRATSWSRTWGPPAPEAADDRCTPAPAPVTLAQGPPDIIERASNGEQHVASYDVGGAEATYSESATANSRRLTWVSDSIGFDLTSIDRCPGDHRTAADVLVEIARSLS